MMMMMMIIDTVTAVFSGILEANGADASGGAGGGSGGGILLSTGALYGKGLIRTNGGKGKYDGGLTPEGCSGALYEKGLIRTRDWGGGNGSALELCTGKVCMLLI